MPLSESLIMQAKRERPNRSLFCKTLADGTGLQWKLARPERQTSNSLLEILVGWNTCLERLAPLNGQEMKKDPNGSFLFGAPGEIRTPDRLVRSSHSEI
jgi:hypothetical protein